MTYVAEFEGKSNASNREVKGKGFTQKVGIRLKKARENARYSKVKVSDITGINDTQLCHFESGRRVPSLETFHKLCELYNADPRDILDIRSDVERTGGTLATDHIGNEKPETTDEELSICDKGMPKPAF